MPHQAASESGDERSSARPRRISPEKLRRRAGEVSTRVGVQELWQRLSSADFMNRAMLFAALLLLMMFPFMIVAAAAVGRDFSTSLAHRMGLNAQASQILGTLFAKGASSSAGSSAGWSATLVFGAVAIAATLQGIYEDIFDLPHRGIRDTPRQAVWVAALLAIVAAVGALGGWLHAPVVLGVVSLALFIGFWWWTLYWLLAGRVSFRPLLPSAVFTALFFVGLGGFSSLYFSSQIISNEKSYGPIGVVLGIMAWLIAVGVVIILGAVTGIVWEQRRFSLGALARRLTRRKSRVP